jgi:hypothetical protein
MLSDIWNFSESREIGSITPTHNPRCNAISYNHMIENPTFYSLSIVLCDRIASSISVKAWTGVCNYIGTVPNPICCFCAQGSRLNNNEHALTRKRIISLKLGLNAIYREPRGESRILGNPAHHHFSLSAGDFFHFLFTKLICYVFDRLSITAHWQCADARRRKEIDACAPTYKWAPFESHMCVCWLYC